MSRFEGRVALVTGGSRGIGRAIALRLASEGADVAVGFFRNREAAERTVADIESSGRRAVALRGNVGDRETPPRLVERAIESLGVPTILVSNAASGVLRALSDTNERGWDWALDVNCYALLLFAQSLRERMRDAGGGAIVALSSLGAERVMPAYGSVGVSKAALEALVRYLAVELAGEGIRVNAVSAGVVRTEALDHFPDRDLMLSQTELRTPAGRYVEPSDVAAAVSFLCSEDAGMVRGHTLVVDGGYSLIA